MGVSFTHKGDFNKVEKWLNSLLNMDYLNMLSMYGQMGVEALSAATPIDTGLAKSSWNYEIKHDGKTSSIIWTNDDIEGGCNVVILIDRGHCTKSGSWVPGYHFIDDAINPVMDRISDAVWKEAIKS